MNNTSKRLLALLLALTLACGLFAGCGKETAPAETAPVETPAPAETPAVTEPEPEPEPQEGKITYDDTVSYTVDVEEEEEPAEEKDLLLNEELPELPAEPAETFSPTSGEEIAEAAEEGEEDPGSVLQEGLSEAAGESFSLGKSDGRDQTKQLTIEDIRAMNPGSTVIDLYSNQGYLSMLGGRFYEEKVLNVEDGVKSIQGMASLLGLGRGCDFFAVYSERNNTGYTFYTYQQRYGGYTLRYATLRIVVDPDGYTAGLSCSFVPNVGTASQEPAISAEEALKIVQTRLARFKLTYFPEHTVRLAVPFGEQVLNCWVVYTNNPDATESFDMPYIEHYVTTDGEYYTLMPANTFAGSNNETMDHSGYFKGMMVQRLTTTLTLEDGTERNLDVPISYNPRDGKYYLMDPERRIAVASYYDFNYHNTVTFVTSDTLDGWEQNNLLAYANYILAYDFYADHGIRSVDGFDTPILVTVGWCDRDGTPVNNACFYGVNNGWACFGVSDINHSSDCLDVVGHEYTHGITNQSMQGVLYRNESGVMNEAYSDIMGNLMEMSMGYTYDDSWLIAERSGRISRSMSDPNAHEQPAFVGDIYYVAPILNPVFEINDYGGVHINNSLVGNIAYRMDEAGMTYEQQISMWLTSVELLTPQSDYQDLHGALLFSLKINGMLQEFGPAINTAFRELGLDQDWTVTYKTAERDGCGRVTMYVDEGTAQEACSLSFYDLEGNIFSYAFPDPDGVITALLPEGQYLVAFQILMDNELQGVILRTDGWNGRGKYAALKIKSGDVMELPSVTGTSSADKLDLFLFDAGYFTMLVPNGWRIEVNGEYTSFSVKIFDPNDPSTQLFYYSYLAPFHKSAAARKWWSRYDKDGSIVDGPVLRQADILGILDSWSYCIDYQQYYDKQIFTDLYDFDLIGGCYYNGPYADDGAIESGCFTYCSTNWDDDCLLTVVSALIDYDTEAKYGGNFFYVCRDLCGVLAPEGRYEDVYEDLIRCLKSLKFSDEYIRESQSVDPMPDQTVITANLNILGNLLKAICETFG